MLKQSADERRQAPRFSLPVAVDFFFENEGRLQVQTRDISASGIFVEVKPNLLMPNHLRFLLTFPREITSSCKLLSFCEGVVVRRESGPDLLGLAIKVERYQFLRTG